jgi:hypothetical protein
VALDESVTLESREAFAVFVGLALPHSYDRISVGVPEAVDDRGVVPEMTIQRGPLSSNQAFHGSVFPPVYSTAFSNDRIGARVRRCGYHGNHTFVVSSEPYHLKSGVALYLWLTKRHAALGGAQ